MAGLTCRLGDCVLHEVAVIEGGWPRQLENDKELGADFPYLAEPWPAHPEERDGWGYWSEFLAGLLTLLLVLLVIWLLRWRKRRIRSWEPKVSYRAPELRT